MLTRKLKFLSKTFCVDGGPSAHLDRTIRLSESAHILNFTVCHFSNEVNPHACNEIVLAK
jgi:hypothetical protein